MKGERSPVGERRTVEGRIDSLLVDRVSGLVDRAEEAGERELREHLRRDAHVGEAEAGRERVFGLVNPAAPEIVADPARDEFGELQLLRRREFPPQEYRPRRGFRHKR